ncbi:MAG: M28 family peptidase [Saprospiraceae bacterium]
MKIKHVIHCLILLLFLTTTACKSTKLLSDDSISISKIKEDVYYLADDKLEGREIGTSGELLAAEYIVKRFKAIGIQPAGVDGSYYQSFTGKAEVDHHGHPVDSNKKPPRGINVIGFLNNNAPTTVVIGGHYDHLGYGHFGSLHAGEPEIHNGADDNASGIAAMLQLAEHLKGRYTNNNYLFIAFSGEEKGLWGSNYFSKNPTVEKSTLNYMINMDMVGRLKEDKTIAINGVGTSPSWMPVIDKLKVDGIKPVTTDSGIGPSDHTSFYLIDVPAIAFFTGQHADYHKPTDDADKVNYPGIQSVVQYIDALVGKLDDSGKLVFTKTKDDSMGGDTPRFTVTLGVMPDYLYGEKGMRIDGVRDGRPASNAKMLAGDIVIQMGEHKVEDMNGYMDALSKFKKGDSTIVKFKRGEKVMEAEVQF